MTSFGIRYQNMKENDFSKLKEPPALVQAFLELDDDSDEEFFDFQFIADAKTNLKEREPLDPMADWKASLASLQLKQAHEVAEFALARRKEDEVRIERQEKEILLLRKTLENSRLETEQVKVMCAMLKEDKLRLAEELAHQIHICETFRSNTTELCEVHERVSGENTELKRSLDEAIVTTGRLKVALEEKAAELVAWLGQDGAVSLGLPSLAYAKDQPPEVPETQANVQHMAGTDHLEALETVKGRSAVDNDSNETDILAREPSDQEDVSASSAAERMSVEQGFNKTAVATNALSQEEDGVSASSGTENNDREEQGVSDSAVSLIGLPRQEEDVSALSGTGNSSTESLKYPIDAQGSISSTSNISGTKNQLQEELSLRGESPANSQGDAVVDSEEAWALHQKVRESQLKVESIQTRGCQVDAKELDEGVTSLALAPQRSSGTIFVCNSGVQTSASGMPSVDEGMEVADKQSRASPTEVVHHDSLADMPHDRECTADQNEQRSVKSFSGTFVPANATPEANRAKSRELYDPLEYSSAMPGDFRNDLEDKYICVSPSDPWSVRNVANVVESISEELMSLLSVIVSTVNTSRQDVLTELDTQVKSWNYLTKTDLQSKLSANGGMEEWKNMVVDFLGASRQELIELQQRLQSCESEPSLVDKLQAECLAASQTISVLKEEVLKLEEQSFTDQIERAEELNLLKLELQHAQEHQVRAEKNAVEEQQQVRGLTEQLGRYANELENSRLGWAAEEDFIDSFLGCATGESHSEDVTVSRAEMQKMEKKLANLMIRLEENDRELGELLIISVVDPDSVLCAKIRRLEQSVEDAKLSDEFLSKERARLLAETESLKSRLADVEKELHLESEQHVQMLIQYEEERSQWAMQKRSDRDMAKLLQVEQLLAEKSKQLELMERERELSPSQSQLLALQSRVVTLENKLAMTRRKAGDCEAAINSQISKEREKCAQAEAKCAVLQTNYAILKKQSSECEQRELRAQSTIDKVMVELGIAKEEVLRYEVRLQKTFKQAREELEIEKRRHEATINSQKQMEWHLCRQLELTEGLEKEKAKIREVVVDFEMQNMALQKESDNLRAAYIQLARQDDQRGG